MGQAHTKHAKQSVSKRLFAAWLRFSFCTRFLECVSAGPLESYAHSWKVHNHRARCLSSARWKTIWPTHEDRGEAWKWKKCGVMGRHGVEKKKSLRLSNVNKRVNKSAILKASGWVMAKDQNYDELWPTPETLRHGGSRLLKKGFPSSSHLWKQKLSIAWSSRRQDLESRCVCLISESIKRRSSFRWMAFRDESQQLFSRTVKSERDCSVH